MSKWYVKQVTPESVIATYDNFDKAEEHALTLNINYQTDNYTVEPYDSIKAKDFPTNLTKQYKVAIIILIKKTLLKD